MPVLTPARSTNAVSQRCKTAVHFAAQTTAARNRSIKSRVEKRLQRFSFIRAEAFIARPIGTL